MIDQALKATPDLSANGSIAGAPGQTKGKVLIVDDDVAVTRVYARALGARGYQVLSASNGHIAEVMFREFKPDTVVSDIGMPGMDGFALLRQVRRIDRDVPVILATGEHRHERAQKAVEEGALMYFVKPVDLRALAQIVDHAAQLHRLAKSGGDTREPVGRAEDRANGRDTLSQTLNSAIEKLTVEFHPIVQWATLAVAGCAVSASSAEPKLSSVAALFAAAQRLGRTLELGRAIRARVAAAVPGLPPKTRIFVNLHTTELDDDLLYSANEPLLRYADRVVLEITERDALDHVTRLADRIDKLRVAGFRIGVDDLGVGYAGLASFAVLKPSVVKLAKSLVRDVDKNSLKRKVVQAMVSLCRDIGVEIVAEGVETEQQRQILGYIGCRYHQGSIYEPSVSAQVIPFL